MIPRKSFLLVLVCACFAFSEETAVKKIEKAKNPHGKKADCSTCHSAEPATNANLKFKTAEQLCTDCHDGVRANREIHPAGMKPSEKLLKNISKTFPLDNGKVSCLTCHDALLQCKGKKNQEENMNFLRGNKPEKEFCFNCHVKEDYTPFNVHDQLDKNGKKKEDVCLWCHTEVPKLSEKMKPSTDFKLRAESEQLCGNCHSVSQNHPVLGNHPIPGNHPIVGRHILAKPTPETFKEMADYLKMDKKEYEKYQVFPLDSTGRITCFSCHNPHEKGLFPAKNPRSMGADEKEAKSTRLRRKKPGENSCKVCH